MDGDIVLKSKKGGFVMNKKRFLSFVMSAAFLASSQMIPFSAFAEDTEEQTVYTGECGADGDNITWTYDTTTQTMTFSGTGEMETYIEDAVSINTPEWTLGDCGKVYDAVDVIFEEGITKIGYLPSDVFGKDKTQGHKLTIPESVTDLDLYYIKNVSLYGKSGSWLYYKVKPKNMYEIGIAENPMIPLDGVSETGLIWHFDYTTRVLNISGTDGKCEHGDFYLFDELSPMVSVAKRIVVNSDFVPPENSVLDTDVGAGTDYVSRLVETYKIICYKDSTFDEMYQLFMTYYNTNDPVIASWYADKCTYVDEDVIHCGDINLDGVINLSDAVTLSKAMANVLTLSDTQKTVADCTGDGTIDDSDVATLMSYLIFLIPSIPTNA
jgi:hypothetical protein